jgi:thiamine-monophosphate kinase
LNGWRIVDSRAVGPQGSAEKPVTELKVLKCLYSHLRPQPYVEEGRLLGKSGLLTSMIDTSDGLSSDLYHICEESGVGAEVNAAVFENDFYEPLRPCLQEDNLLDLILHGGEDFLLLFTVKPQDKENLEELLQKQLINDYLNIGIITDKKREMRLHLSDGSRKELHPGGWEHK